MKKLLLIGTLFSISQLFGMEGASDTKKARTDDNQEKRLTAKQLITLGDSSHQRGLFREAITCFETALPRATTVGDLYYINFMLGTLYKTNNDTSSSKDHTACNYFENALKVVTCIQPQTAQASEKVNEQLGKTLHNLTSCCFDIGKHTDVLKYGERAVVVCKSNVEKANMYRLLGLSHRTTNDLVRSEDCLSKGIDLLDKEHRKIDCRTKKSMLLYGTLHKNLADTLWLQLCGQQGEMLIKSAETVIGHYKTSLMHLDSLKERSNVWVQLGLIYHTLRNRQFAQNYFESATEESVKDANKSAYNVAKYFLSKYAQQKI